MEALTGVEEKRRIERPPLFASLNMISLCVYSGLYLIILPGVRLAYAFLPYHSGFDFFFLHVPTIAYGLVRWTTFYRIRRDAVWFRIVTSLFELFFTAGLAMLKLLPPPAFGTQDFEHLIWTLDEFYFPKCAVVYVILYLFLTVALPLWCVFSMGDVSNPGIERRVRFYIILYIMLFSIYSITCLLIIGSHRYITVPFLGYEIELIV